MSEPKIPKINCAYDEIAEIKSLRPNLRNRNKHKPTQLARFAKIIDAQGIRRPVRVSNRSGFITAGHGLVLAAKVNGYTHLPVDYQDYESEEQEYQDLIADNSIAAWSELDYSAISLDIQEIGSHEFDIDLLGLENFTVDMSEKDTKKKEKKCPHCQGIL